MSGDHVLVGFGFGPIQAGLFVKEAAASGNFRRLVVAEIDEQLVEAVRKAGNRYALNTAHPDHIERFTISDVELCNPADAAQRESLLAAIAEATEIVTALPSVDLYEGEATTAAATLLAEGFRGSTAAHPVIVYTAENNNHAAEILADAVGRRGGPRHGGRIHYLNTVIGKMSRTVKDSVELKALGLTPIAPGMERAFLIESFNRILVSRCRIAEMVPGIRVFEEKDDLLPFEEAKLYGHNAIHALLAFLGDLRGYRRMAELKQDALVMQIARSAFLDEAGAALLSKYGKLGDPLFTREGFQRYADDLLERMTNPYLADAVERVGRDPVRKLGSHDRIFGAMALALDVGIEPRNLAVGAAAGLVFLLKRAAACGVPERFRYDLLSHPCDAVAAQTLLGWIWGDHPSPHGTALMELVTRALAQLPELRRQ
ncbi:MAG: hypothetical protein ACUVWX_02400 [Kiritimatiellia bacterium]